ncbi:MAG: hypothetical protein JKY66_11155 [Spongiibacteraceae bacterium]|nr:hypothetical protein [Spongiibacteraceae bacterium]
MRPLLIYIHGFNSSSQSQKAQEVHRHLVDNNLEIDFLAPTFANYPGQSYQQLIEIVTQQRQKERSHIALIGSSLGGFMASSAAQSLGLKAVLINPAVHPYRLIGSLLGENTNPYTGEKYTLLEKHVEELRNIEPATLSFPERLLVMLQTGDETLDYRIAKEYYKHSLQIVESGGDHRFQNFDRHLAKVLQFLELTTQ